MVCLAYAFMLSLRRQLCGGGRIFMSAQSGNTADNRQADHKNSTATIFTSARAYARNHREVMAAVTVAAITAAVIVPYIATAGTESFGNVIAGRPVSNTRDDVSDMDQQKRQTLQQTTNNNSTSNETNITVNGRQLPVPDNGSYHTTIDDGDSHTDVKVESSQNSTSNGGSNTSNSSVHFNVQTESHSGSETSSD
jgi:uncharacterized membrane protein YvbJ